MWAAWLFVKSTDQIWSLRESCDHKIAGWYCQHNTERKGFCVDPHRPWHHETPTAKHHKSAMLLMDCGGSKVRSCVQQHAVHSAPDNYFTSCSLCCDATRCVHLRGIVHIGLNRRPEVSICWSAAPQDCRISAPVTNDSHTICNPSTNCWCRRQRVLERAANKWLI